MATASLLKRSVQFVGRSHFPVSPALSIPADGFVGLITAIRQHLGHSYGIGSADVDEEHLIALMAKYKSDSREWAQFARHDPSKAYSRNLIDKMNGKANLLLLVWSPGQGSPIHDHANAHCIMKILQGSLRETVFESPADRQGGAVGTTLLNIKKDSIYTANQITYISDQIGLHRVCNPDPTEVAVSLHLYTPPNASDYGYHVYDEKTGERVHVSPS